MKPRFKTSRSAFEARGTERGFTLLELLTSTAIAVFLIIVILDLFEASARINRVQSDVADIQQGQRIVQSEVVRMAQMAGRGGLPGGIPPTGLALAIRNDVPEDEYISPGDSNTPAVRPGTDVLTIRGVFSTPIYQINYGARGEVSDFTLNDADPASATAGTVVIRRTSNSSIPQNLTPLIDAINNRVPEALIFIHPLTEATYAVLELDPSSSVINADSVTVGFFITGGSHSDLYLPLSSGGAFPTDLNNAAFMGILEEYRYYVRDQEIAGQPVPLLARARAFPGTEAPYAGLAANWGLEIADGIYDQQLALGVDRNNDGQVVDGLVAGSETSTDEYLFNDGEDDATDATWGTGVLSYLRITTLVRGDRKDNRYASPILEAIEDHEYGSSHPFNSDEERQYRRRVVTTTLDLRNLG